MKNRARKPTVEALNPVERAIITRDWRAGVSLARIAAITSDNSDKMVDRAGRVLFVVLGAAMANNMHEDQWQIRILRGAANAVFDQAGEAHIPAERRASIARGLEVAAELVPTFTHEQLTHAACDLALKLKRGHVNISDFEAILQKAKVAYDGQVCL